MPARRATRLDPAVSLRAEWRAGIVKTSGTIVVFGASGFASWQSYCRPWVPQPSAISSEGVIFCTSSTQVPKRSRSL